MVPKPDSGVKSPAVGEGKVFRRGNTILYPGLFKDVVIRKRLTLAVLFMLLIVGVVTRLYDIGENPAGLNVDEASAGYDAYALANYGITRNGHNFPVHLTAWGSGQNALYAYIIMPVIKIFGLSPVTSRIGNFIFGVLTIIFLFYSVKRIAGTKIALVAAFILTISPWGIMTSRWGLPENIMPAFVMMGVYFFTLSLDRPAFLYLSSAAFGLSLYGYGTAYVVVPPLMVLMAVLGFQNAENRKAYLKMLARAALLFVIIALPIAMFVYLNLFSDIPSSIKLGFITIPRLTTPGARYAQVIMFDPNLKGISPLLARLAQNFQYYYYTVFEQKGASWSVINNQAHRFGSLFLFGNIFFLVGFCFAAADIFSSVLKKRLRHESLFMLWFIIATILGVISETNTNRMNIIFLPMIFFTAYGVCKAGSEIGTFITHFIGGESRKPAVFTAASSIAILLIAAVYLSSFYAFAGYYYPPHLYPDHIGSYFNYSMKDAVEYVEKNNTGGKTVYMSNVSMGYIYVLYYTKYNPHDFIRTVVYNNPYGSFREVLSFGNYRFIFPKEAVDPQPDSFYIVDNEKIYSTLASPPEKIKRFKRFSVLEY
ncbi:MAG: ArnT family glycosyltransferase [Bacillota bacterium]